MAAAANANEIRDYCKNVLSFPDDDIVDALEDQGLTKFDDFLSITDEGVTALCKRICDGSGFIENPAYKAGAKGNVPPQIKDPGISIGWVHETKLRQLRYARFHFQRIQRPFTAGEATMDRLVALWELFLEEQRIKKETEMDMPERLVKVDRVRDSLEDIQNFLENTHGAFDAPLSYVIREDARKPEDRTPPVNTGFGVPTMKEELIDRAIHEGIRYDADNAKVWQVVRHVTHGGPAWAWVQGFERARNGRAAFIALKEHYHGDSFQARTKAAASKTIATSFYDGKSRQFSFERYAQIMKGAFEDMARCGEPLVNAAKVRHFLDGIRDSRLDSACVAIKINEALREDLPGAINVLSEVIDHKQIASPRRSIGSMDRGKGGRGNRNGTPSKGGRGGQGKPKKYDPNMVITDRHYSPDEWSVMSSAQKTKALEMRAERDKRRGVMSVGRNTPSKRSHDETDGHYGPRDATNQGDSQTGTNNQAGIGSMATRRNQQGRS